MFLFNTSLVPDLALGQRFFGGFEADEVFGLDQFGEMAGWKMVFIGVLAANKKALFRYWRIGANRRLLNGSAI